MLEHVFGLLLVGLGLQTPSFPAGSVMGDQTEVVATQETEATRAEYKKTVLEKQEKLKAAKTEVSNKAKETRETVSSNAAQKKAQVREEVEQARTDWEARREAMKQQLETQREQARTAYQENREAFQARLEKISDVNKQKIVSSIDQGIMRVNQARTEAWMQQLVRMEEILAKVSERIVKAKEAGLAVTEAQNAVSEATTAINAAKSAVTTQAGKEYIIGITTEQDLRDMVAKTRAQFEADLRAVQELVQVARERVSEAIQIASGLRVSTTTGTTGSEGGN